jgi:glycosyltransferase involved in cell wall biosynthesis
MRENPPGSNGIVHETETQLEHAYGEPASNGSPLDCDGGADSAPSRLREIPAEPTASRPALAIISFEEPATPLGQYAGNVALALAQRHTDVHFFTRKPYAFFHPGVSVHAVGDCAAGENILAQVEEFTRRACEAFDRKFAGSSTNVTLLGYDWSAVPTQSLLHASTKMPTLLSLHSLERQRCGLWSETSRQIDDLEVAGLRKAQTVLTHEASTAEIARDLVPECAARMVSAQWRFPAELFNSQLDPGAVKARFQVGPVDPTILYIGDLNERHGPDVLMKSLPAILKNHKQARFIFVGEGELLWPLRVHARYLLLEHAVRLVGSLVDQPLYELIQAADIIAVPSREQTEWWPILAGWASRRPVVTTHEMVASLGLRHEQDSVLVYPNPASCVWGIERLLYDPPLGQAIAAEGHKTLEERFGWAAVARQIQALLSVEQAR